MAWSLSIWWWIATGILVAAELATGTFYLLMLAVGSAAAAIAAYFGVAFSGQLVAAALIGGGAVALWHVKRSREPAAAPVSENRDVNLDIGERVRVTQWDPDGSARVNYRGAAWSARFAGSGTPAPGEHVIRAVDGNRLLLDRLP
jgi:membrane protein implicated in regulation of membrane protease activity